MKLTRPPTSLPADHPFPGPPGPRRPSHAWRSLACSLGLMVFLTGAPWACSDGGGGDETTPPGEMEPTPPAEEPGAGCSSGLHVDRGPYLQLGTPDGVVVRWRTSMPTASRVSYGPSPDRLDQTVDLGGSRWDHSVPITGLEPATRYHYAVGNGDELLEGGDDAHHFTTSPPVGSDVRTRVWVIGDSGTATPLQAAVTNVYKAHVGEDRADLWLMLGDNAYSSGYQPEYQRAVFGMYPDLLRNTVLWSTFGNHDGGASDSATQSGPYYEIFEFPTAGEAGGVASGTEAYYSFDHANVHFVCLDSHETDRSVGGAMLTWLEADLADTTQDWIVAFWHHPPYTKGSHDSDAEGQLIEMRENALPILEGFGVDLVLTGHSHVYERSYLIDGHYGPSGSFDPSMRVDPGDGRVDGSGPYAKSDVGTVPHEGAVYVVAGSSGQVSNKGTLQHPAMAVSLRKMGSLILDFEGNRLDAEFVSPLGGVTDHFTIRKGP